MEEKEIGLIGLGVMGASLCLNLASKGYSVLAYNRNQEKARKFMDSRAVGLPIARASTLQELVKGVRRPRKILLMVSAGSPVDAVMQELLPMMEPGDILIDGGNSFYQDTERRGETAGKHGILYVGLGVSGGETGALYGPSLMPGGDKDAWEALRPVLTAIAAKAEDGNPCCAWIGPQGAGHYVKMVHNGIEYGDMQLICEVYALMRDVLGMTPLEMADAFCRWNEGPLKSYLISITAEILTVPDPDGQGFLVDKILDVAGQKGTGKWAAEAALSAGVPLALITESVFARDLSARKEQRVAASVHWSRPSYQAPAAQQVLPMLERALYTAKIISYAQGFEMMRQQSASSGWQLNLGQIALVWRAGCIICSGFLERVKDAYQRDPQLSNLMEDPYFQKCLTQDIPALREIVCMAARAGVCAPALSSALAYYDGFHTARLPTNLLQAQRDYFGAHTVQRIDRDPSAYFHYRWEELSAKTAKE